MGGNRGAIAGMLTIRATKMLARRLGIELPDGLGPTQTGRVMALDQLARRWLGLAA